MVKRSLNVLKSNSFFLFGARGTGKSTLLKHYFVSDSVIWINLLDPEQEDRFSRRPQELAELIAAREKETTWVVIDEIQKVPKLLDVVHNAIEEYGVLFALTGSSARKLKSQSVNLLAGRAFVEHLFPLTHLELGQGFELESVLTYGSLPKLLSLESNIEKNAFLRAYALTYLKEEVWNEHLVRDLDPFRKFIEVAAQCNGEMINYSNIARDVGVSYKTVQEYFSILEETLLGYMLEPYHTSVRKRQRQAPKFYLFDTGVKRALDRTLTVPLLPQTSDYGNAFEHFIVIEMNRLSEYAKNDYRFYYLRTKDDVEIDLIIDRPGRPLALVEIKSAERIDKKHISAIKGLLGDFPGAEAMILSREKVSRIMEGVKIEPWRTGIAKLLS
ncbi:MAG: ATP-binding protein [Planctomycetes bacterium]|nr:ATP-binding protein [Planctomycetota bacterium]